MPSGAVESVLRAIERHPDSDVLIGRRIACSASLKPIFRAPWFAAKEDVTAAFTSKEAVCSLFDKINITTAICGLISVIVFKKAAWDSVTDYEPYIGSAYLQTYKLMRALSASSGALTYFTEEIALARHGNDSFYNNLAQRIMLDVDAFLRISAVFADKDEQNSFLGIVRRHFNSTFLYAMALSAYPVPPEIIEKIRQTGYSDRQIKILTKPKALLYPGLLFSLFRFLFSDPGRFIQTVKIALQKIK